MNLGKRIKSWRRAKELTQQDLADACGITAGAVSLWESGDSAPSQKHLATVVKRLGLSMEQFYGAVPKAEAA